MAKTLAGGEDKIYELYGDDPKAMAGELLAAARVEKLIPSGAGVAIKPNLVIGRPASEGATTHPEIVAGIIEFLLDHGHRNIDIIEGSWLGDDTGRAFAVCGMADLAKRYGVGIHDLKKDATVSRDTLAGKIKVCRRALEAGFLINLPVLKGHCQTRVTCALKNMKGCIPDTEKRRFHRDGLDECIAALATAIVPHLSVVDGICGDLDFEEGGNPVRADRMLLGRDPVLLDAYVCALMGIPASEVGYIPLAARYGVGRADLVEGDVVHLNRPRPGSGGAVSGKVRKLARHVDADQACSACYANVIHALKRMDEVDGLSGVPRVRVGQGWQGRGGDGVGVGRCCGDGAVAGCPPAALDIVKALEAVRGS